MANNYSHCVGEYTVAATQQEYEALAAQLAADTEAADLDDINGQDHGMVAEYYDGRVHISDDCGTGSLEALSEESLRMIGAMAGKAGLPAWDFGLAYTCDKNHPGEFGGGKVRVTADGRLEWADLVYPTGPGEETLMQTLTRMDQTLNTLMGRGGAVV